MDTRGYRFDEEYREKAELKDGSRVELRVVRPEDRELLRRGFDRLSAQSRYLRFMGRKAELSEAELEALTTLDGEDHFAIGALRRDPGTGELEGLGVARFARLPDAPAVAEAAVTVVDAVQGQGLGSVLLRRLAAAARERGVERFRGDILACNEPMRRLLAGHVDATVIEPEDEVLRVSVELPSFADLTGVADRGDLLGRLLAQAARGGFTMRMGDLLLKRRRVGKSDSPPERRHSMDRIWTKHYDEGVPTDLEMEKRTVVDFFDAAVEAWGERPAVTLKGKTLTYAELRDHVDRFATGLAGLGVTKDSRVALWMPNLPQMVIAYFATLRLGAQVVNTNPLYVEREIEHQFNDAGVSVVVTLDFLWEGRLRGILDRTSIEHVVVTSIPDYLPFPLSWLAPLKLRKTGQYAKVTPEEGVHFFKDMIADNAPEPPAVELSLDDVAVLQYTGGTTGVSKGAMLTHRNISANTQQCRAWFPGARPGEEVFLSCLPFFHVFGMTVSMLLPVAVGAQLVLAPNPRDIQDLVKSITKYRVTLFPALPALFVAINNYPGIDGLDVSSVRYCISGSAPLPVEVLERFEELTGSKITEGFGLTETSPLTHANPLDGLRKVGSVGVPVPGTDMKIVDVETGDEELGFDEEGELCIKGPQAMAGYWSRPEETARTLRNGWVHTGDLARVDEEGYTYIVGRKKDMIVASGYNIYPDEVDGVLYTHPAVLEAATIGVPDPKRGETVKSFIVLKPDAEATVEELSEFCKKELAPYKVPKQIELVDELPKSSMMKILRRELREREIEKAGKETEAARG